MGESIFIFFGFISSFDKQTCVTRQIPDCRKMAREGYTRRYIIICIMGVCVLGGVIHTFILYAIRLLSVCHKKLKKILL